MKFTALYAATAVLLGLVLTSSIPAFSDETPRRQDSQTDAMPSPGSIVDSLNGVFGAQTEGRAIHAKGIVLEGVFRPNKSARSLSKEILLSGPPVRVTVRFSDFAGIPTVADTDALATPRGMAVKFWLPDGSQTDIVTHSFNGFPTKTAEQFRELMVALGASNGKPSPTPTEAFLAEHPAAKSFFDHLPPPPTSYAAVEYYGVNSFRFANAHGRSQFGRYQLVPTDGVHFLPKEMVSTAAPDYLQREIRQRVARDAVLFTLQVQLAAAGDVIDDPSIAWPDSRPIVKLGVIRVSRVDEQSDADERQLLFSPAAVMDGVEPADPMIGARSAAYGVSYQRRHSAH